MKISSCYNCGSIENTFYAEENGFSLVKCSMCGLLFIQNRPDDDEISQAHKQGKHSGNKALDATGVFESDKIVGYLKVLEDLFRGDLDGKKTWLDVGCGHGEFIVAVQKYSSGKINIIGTEPNVHKRESAQKRGLNVDYFDLDTLKEKFDVISILNVYSHLPSPPQFIESLRKLLNPGGILIIQTGDTAELSAQDHYRPFYLPDHLSFASETIIVQILARLGFEVVNIKKYPLIKFNIKTIIKELVKAILPQYKSKISYLFGMKSLPLTDMFIYARLRNP